MKKVVVIILIILLGTSIVILNNMNVSTDESFGKVQVPNKNLAMPNLSTATYIGGGTYRLYDSNGIIIDYNENNGYHMINGVATSNIVIYYIDEITMNIEYGSTYYVKYHYVSGSAKSSLGNNILGSMNYRTETTPSAIRLSNVNGATFTVDNEPNNQRGIRADIKAGDIFDNLTFRVQVEKGDKATTYVVPKLISLYKDNLTLQQKREIGLGAFNGITNIVNTINGFTETVQNLFNNVINFFKGIVEFFGFG